MNKKKQYQKITDKPILYCDVDDTLVMWPAGGQPIPGRESEYISIADIPSPVLVKPHKEHINLLKQFAARGHTIVVWSQGGSDWAENVVKALGLKECVDLIMPKPYWFVDDLQSHQFMTEGMRIYKKDES